MEESSLKRLALVVLLLGMPLLYVTSAYTNSTCQNEDTLTARIYSSSQKSDLTILTVSKFIPVVIRSKDSLPCGSTVQFQGSYQDYNGQKEFVANSYSIIKESKTAKCRSDD